MVSLDHSSVECRNRGNVLDLKHRMEHENIIIYVTFVVLCTVGAK